MPWFLREHDLPTMGVQHLFLQEGSHSHSPRFGKNRLEELNMLTPPAPERQDDKAGACTQPLHEGFDARLLTGDFMGTNDLG